MFAALNNSQLPTRLLLALLAAYVPGHVMAEGAVRTFHCALEQICDADGDCESESGEVVFRMEPQQLDANGAGSYQLSYAGIHVPMRANSDAGPFTWSHENDQHALLVNSATGLLWHRLSLEPPLQADTRYLQCTLQQ